MKKNQVSILSFIFLCLILAWIYLTMMPFRLSEEMEPLSDFSSKRAVEKIKTIAKAPHYVGSAEHERVADYLLQELKALGLETRIEGGTTLSDWGNLVKSKNIMARIKGTSGNGKALLLLSHYDSAPHSMSPGAADNGSGVATILEGLRAFLYAKTHHKNDIIILFSDAEELGLNGAALFVTQSPWAKDVGLALNFEARGTSGPSYMLMEVNGGNARMVQAFADAQPEQPVSNSLMYSIYKMLPNDTDLTVFREQGQIQGFNFAFIDSHFNYHTAQDDLNHLSRETLAHQGTYLMPLLNYFSNSNLSELNSGSDHVYFNTPFAFIHYPFSWNFPLIVAAFLLFIFLVFIGIGKRILVPSEMGKGFLTFLGAILIVSLLTYFGWNALLGIYPEYNDILQGFTYNGHSYIWAFTFPTFAIAFIFYAGIKTETSLLNYTVAPLFLWLLINLGIAVFLPGAGFFIIPVFCSLLMFGFFVVSQRSSSIINALLAIPALIIFAPLIIMFPIGLGLKMLAAAALLSMLLFGLLLPVFGVFRKKAIWALAFFLISCGFFIHANMNAGYSPGKAKPNSLLYIYNAERDKAVWATYDQAPDDWNKLYLTDNPTDGKAFSDFPLFSKYNTGFTFTADALVRDLPEPTIDFLMDSIINTQRYITIRISPNRNVNRYDIFAADQMVFHNLKANGAAALGQKGSRYVRNGKKLLSYYVVGNEPLELQFSIPKNTVFDMSLLESSFDLMTNPLFRMAKRSESMMPTPFVLNDAIVVQKKINPSAVVSVPMPIQKNFALPETVGDTIRDMDEVPNE